MININKVLEKYNEVYDEQNGEFRLCGRDKCFELIDCCNEYAKLTNSTITEFGDIYGRVNIENVQRLLK